MVFRSPAGKEARAEYTKWFRDTAELKDIGKMPLEKLRGARAAGVSRGPEENSSNQSFEVVRIDGIDIEDHGENGSESFQSFDVERLEDGTTEARGEYNLGKRGVRPDVSEMQRERIGEEEAPPMAHRTRGGGLSQLVDVRDVDNSPRAERERAEGRGNQQVEENNEGMARGSETGSGGAMGNQENDPKTDGVRATERRGGRAKGADQPDRRTHEEAGDTKQPESKGKAKPNKPPSQASIGPNTDNEEGLSVEQAGEEIMKMVPGHHGTISVDKRRRIRNNLSFIMEEYRRLAEEAKGLRASKPSTNDERLPARRQQADMETGIEEALGIIARALGCGIGPIGNGTKAD